MGTSRRHRSNSEQQELVQRWHGSGQSQASFAKQVGISVKALRRWLSSAEAQFAEVVRPKPVAPRDFLVHVGGGPHPGTPCL